MNKVHNSQMRFSQICQNPDYIKKQPLGGTQLLTTRAKTEDSMWADVIYQKIY